MGENPFEHTTNEFLHVRAPLVYALKTIQELLVGKSRVGRG